MPSYLPSRQSNRSDSSDLFLTAKMKIATSSASLVTVTRRHGDTSQESSLLLSYCLLSIIYYLLLSFFNHIFSSPCSFFSAFHFLFLSQVCSAYSSSLSLIWKIDCSLAMPYISKLFQLHCKRTSLLQIDSMQTLRQFQNKLPSALCVAQEHRNQCRIQNRRVISEDSVPMFDKILTEDGSVFFLNAQYQASLR